MTNTVVVGAGISGLTAAYTLHQAGVNVQILEASDRSGGLIHSQTEAGFLTEAGPNTFPSTATEILALCAQLGLQSKAADAQAKKRYLYLNKKLTALPTHPLQALTTPVLSPSAKLKILQEPFQSKIHAADISISDFISHRLGNEAAERLFDPFISGIYAGDIKTLSLPAVFPKLWEWEQKHDSLLKGIQTAKKAKQSKSKMQLLSFENGLESLTKAFVSALPIGCLKLNTRVQNIQASDSGYQLQLDNGETLHTQHIILAVPASIAASLLQGIAPQSADALQDIPYAGLAVVHTGFERTHIPHPLDGFGFLIPRRENLPLLGSIWASSLFPERAPNDHILLSSYIGGVHQPEIATWESERIEHLVLENLATVFKISQPLKPAYSRILKYQQAIPQYTLGHRERIQTALSALASQPGIQLCGNYLHGIGLNECVKSGLQAAQTIINNRSKL